MMKLKKVLSIVLLFVMMVNISGCNKKSSTIVLNGSDDDSQPGWNIYNQYVAKAENGYYFIKNKLIDSYLYYMDNTTRQTIPLCSKAECNHNNSECNAYLSRESENEYSDNTIYYYKGKIYLVCHDRSKGLSYLVRVAPDGSERERVFEIGAVSEAYKLAFGGDAVYIYNRAGGHGIDATTENIRRRTLDGKEDDIIYSISEENIQTSAVKIYDGKAFLLVTKWEFKKDEKKIDASGKGVLVYDPETKKTEKFIDGNVSDFTIDIKNNVLYYYIMNDGLYKRNLDDGKEEKLLSYENGLTEICHISCDGTYLYMNNEITKNMISYNTPIYLWVLDNDGKELNRIETENTFFTLFGEGDYIFGMGKSDVKYIPKNEITTATEWITI